MITVEFADLVGLHDLDGVDTYVDQFKNDWDGMEDASAVRFRLDGTVYIAVEDPSDGYRSSMRCLFRPRKTKKDPMLNVFPAVKVLVRHKTEGDYQRNDILEFIDVVTAKTVLEIGTSNVGDYYPSFVSAFWPENMATNAEAKP